MRGDGRVWAGTREGELRGRQDISKSDANFFPLHSATMFADNIRPYFDTYTVDTSNVNKQVGWTA